MRPCTASLGLRSSAAARLHALCCCNTRACDHDGGAQQQRPQGIPSHRGSSSASLDEQPFRHELFRAQDIQRVDE
jgi:hypothetical protein